MEGHLATEVPRSTLPSNAPTIAADVVQGTYKPSQTPWSEAELLWARGSQSGVVAARGDYAKAFNYADTSSDIPYARRDWVFLPEGEIVVIDRAHTNNAGEAIYLNFHTPSTLTKNGGVSTATIGDSKLSIHTVLLSGGTPMRSPTTTRGRTRPFWASRYFDRRSKAT